MDQFIIIQITIPIFDQELIPLVIRQTINSIISL